MSDITDDVIETLVRAREAGLAPADVHDLVRDVFNAPWSRRSPKQHQPWTRSESRKSKPKSSSPRKLHPNFGAAVYEAA
jgi:hypothetical protein